MLMSVYPILVLVKQALVSACYFVLSLVRFYFSCIIRLEKEQYFWQRLPPPLAQYGPQLNLDFFFKPHASIMHVPSVYSGVEEKQKLPWICNYASALLFGVSLAMPQCLGSESDSICILERHESATNLLDEVVRRFVSRFRSDLIGHVQCSLNRY